MRIRIACLGAIALGLLAGAACADAFSDLAALPTFYTGAGMKTMKPMAGFKKARFAMSKHDRVTIPRRATTRQ